MAIHAAGGITGSATSTGSFGNIDITGDAIIHGTLTAREMAISSSVTNVTTLDISGSSKFGDSGDDIHQFTGSLNVTGSIQTKDIKIQTFAAPSDNYSDAHRRTIIGNTSGNILLTTSGSVAGTPKSSYVLLSHNQWIKLGAGATNEVTNPEEGITIRNTGFVGIGSTSPGALLDLKGTNTDIQLHAPTGNAKGFLGTTGTAILLASNIKPSDQSISLSSRAAAQILLDGQNNKSHIFMYTSNTNNTAPTLRVRLNESGNFGIGPNDPTEKLDVTGNIKASGNISGSSISTGSFGHGNFDGNVGIGTKSPSKKLEVFKSSEPRIRVTSGNSGNPAYEWAVNNDRKWVFYSAQHLGTNTMYFKTNTTNIMALKQDGDVGIGNDNPSFKLDVGGTGRFTGTLTTAAITTTGITSTGNISGSATSTGSFGKLLGDGSSLTGISTTPFPFTGSANISGSLKIKTKGRELFNVLDNFNSENSGSDQILFSAHNIAGAPILQAEASRSRVIIGGSSGLETFFKPNGHYVMQSSSPVSASFEDIVLNGSNIHDVFINEGDIVGFPFTASHAGGPAKAGIQGPVEVTGSIVIETDSANSGSSLFRVRGNHGNLIEAVDDKNIGLFRVPNLIGFDALHIDKNSNITFDNGVNPQIISGSLYSTGSFGRVVATKLVGDGSGITGLTSAAISTYNNAADNRIITSVDASTVQGEANLTFDGTTLSGSASSTGSFALVKSGVTRHRVLKGWYNDNEIYDLPSGGDQGIRISKPTPTSGNSSLPIQFTNYFVEIRRVHNSLRLAAYGGSVSIYDTNGTQNIATFSTSGLAFDMGSISGVTNVTATGNISGSATSTGSFGRVNIGVPDTDDNMGMSVGSTVGSHVILSIYASTANKQPSLQWKRSDGEKYYIQHESSGLNHKYYAGSGGSYPSYMFVDNSQNIGMGGQTSPSHKLDVTGTGRFTSNLTVGGNIIAQGDITAQRLIVSSSVTNMVIAEKSGSTIFGDSIDDTHTFIGSKISGSATSTGSFGKLFTDSHADIQGQLFIQPQNNTNNGTTAEELIIYGASSEAGIAIVANADANNYYTSYIKARYDGAEGFYIKGPSGDKFLSYGHTGTNTRIGVSDTAGTLHLRAKTISGSAVSTGSFGKLLGDGSSLTGISSTPFPFTGSAGISGSIAVKDLTAATGSTMLSVQGSEGTLFSVVNSMTGSIFSANTVAGIPIIEAFSNGDVHIGPSGSSFAKLYYNGYLQSSGSGGGGSGTGFPFTGSAGLSGSLDVRHLGAATGSTLLSVNGSEGTLFSVVNSMTGSIFSANTTAGIPVIEAFSDGDVTFGPLTSKISGSSISTGSFGKLLVGGSEIASSPNATDGSQNTISGSAISTGSFGSAHIANNVGIGTTNPDTKLHLADNSHNYLTLEGTHASTAHEVALKYSNSTTSTSYWWAGMNDSNTPNYSIAYGTLFSNGNTKLTILNNGRVGIGTVTPERILHVAGDVVFKDIGSSTNVRIDAPANLDSSISFAENGTDRWYLWHEADNDHLEFYVTGQNPAASGAAVLYRLGPTGTFELPTANTKVSGSATSTGSFGHGHFASNVGIGTTNPARKLEIKDTSSNVGLRLVTGTALDAIIDFGDTGDADIGQIRYDNNTDKMHFRTNASDRLTIDSGGDVLISTNDAKIKADSTNTLNIQAHQLKILGSGGEERFQLQSEGNSNPGVFMIKQSEETTTIQLNSDGVSYLNGGNVGIGITTPSEKLDVVGNIKASGNIIAEGDIIAQRYIVSSSVSVITSSFSSGSTIFGDTLKDTHQFTGSLNVKYSGSVGDNTAFSIEGNTGNLLEITDSQTGSLFNVNDVSGVPIFDVNSNDTITMGQFSSPIRVLTDSNGNTMISGSATSTAKFGQFTEASSIAFKTNVETLQNPLDKISQLRGVTYNLKANNEPSIGMIAEEVNKVFPELVDKDNNGNPQAMSYTRMTAVLLEAVKELTEEVKELKKANIYNKYKDKE